MRWAEENAGEENGKSGVLRNESTLRETVPKRKRITRLRRVTDTLKDAMAGERFVESRDLVNTG